MTLLLLLFSVYDGALNLGAEGYSHVMLMTKSISALSFDVKQTGKFSFAQVWSRERHQHSESLSNQYRIHFHLRSSAVLQATIGEHRLDSTIVSQVDEIFLGVTVITSLEFP